MLNTAAYTFIKLHQNGADNKTPLQIMAYIGRILVPAVAFYFENTVQVTIITLIFWENVGWYHKREPDVKPENE